MGILSDIYNSLPTTTDIALRRAKNVTYFCDGDATWNYGEFAAWEKACWEAGKCLPPKDFKKAK